MLFVLRLCLCRGVLAVVILVVLVDLLCSGCARPRCACISISAYWVLLGLLAVVRLAVVLAVPHFHIPISISLSALRMVLGLFAGVGLAAMRVPGCPRCCCSTSLSTEMRPRCVFLAVLVAVTLVAVLVAALVAVPVVRLVRPVRLVPFILAVRTLRRPPQAEENTFVKLHLRSGVWTEMPPLKVRPQRKAGFCFSKNSAFLV